jgi:hypothetical protein
MGAALWPAIEKTKGMGEQGITRDGTGGLLYAYCSYTQRRLAVL